MFTSRSVAATSEGIAKIKARMAELEKPILPGKTGKFCWTQEHLAKQANVSLDTVKRFLKEIAIDQGYAIAIVKALNLKLEDIVNFPKPDPEPLQPNDIDWYQICKSRLDAYEKSFLKNNPLTGINFYVPLGLVEPKREQEKRQKQEVNPEDGSQFYQLAETEITKTYNEPNQFFEDVLRQGNSKSKGQRLAVIGEPGAGKTTLLYQIARWILQENLGYPILIRLADVDKPIRDYLTQNWLRDAKGGLREVSPEWVAGFEMLITKKQNYSADYSAVETASTQTKPAFAGCEPLDFSSVREGGHRLCSREFHSPDTSSPSADYSAVETASTQTKPAVAGCEPLDFSSVREGGHRLYSREFHSPDTSSPSSPSSPDYSADYSAVETASTQTKPACAGSQIVPFSQQVYLLLDAVDEMGITSPLVTINQQLAEGWTQGLRVVLTCRLNVWEGEKNALRDFDVYRNLDFNFQQIQDFIEQWFNDKTQSQELLKQLKETNQNRINDLIKNPLRLALLCRTWKRGQKLPETQAGLYQRLVNSHYQWKDEQKPFQIPFDVQECLHQQLGELAKTAINREQFRFRLEEKFVEQYLGKPQRENTLFNWALKLGWLNRVGLASVEEKDSDQAVYAFFHPTFQEYFAALAIKDWDYFLPRNHVNCPVEGKEYRIFQPQWKQVILLWLGRDDVESGEKEAFIQKLVNFDGGCGDFYAFQSFFIAAHCISEFCSIYTEKIIQQLIDSAFGYFDDQKIKWQDFPDIIGDYSQTTLLYTNSKSVINKIQNQFFDESINLIPEDNLLDVISFVLSKKMCNQIIDKASQILMDLIKKTKNKNIQYKACVQLGKIMPKHIIYQEFLTWLLNGGGIQEDEMTDQYALQNEIRDIILFKKIDISNLEKWEWVEISLKFLTINGEKAKNSMTILRDFRRLLLINDHRLITQAIPYLKDYLYPYSLPYKLLWQCAQNLTYPKFYQAWHHNILTPHPEVADNTPVGNTPTVRQLEQQFTDICTQLPHLPLHCININKLLTLNTKNEFIQAFCNRLYQKLLPDVTPPEVQTPANLETKIIHLKQQLQTPQLFILLLADGTPTPEVLDCCDYLTDVLHLGWITPDPLPLPPPQRSFVASQENLLAAVESWVAEY